MSIWVWQHKQFLSIFNTTFNIFPLVFTCWRCLDCQSKLLAAAPLPTERTSLPFYTHDTILFCTRSHGQEFSKPFGFVYIINLELITKDMHLSADIKLLGWCIILSGLQTTTAIFYMQSMHFKCTIILTELHTLQFIHTTQKWLYCCLITLFMFH